MPIFIPVRLTFLIKKGFLAFQASRIQPILLKTIRNDAKLSEAAWRYRLSRSHSATAFADRLMILR